MERQAQCRKCRTARRLHPAAPAPPPRHPPRRLLPLACWCSWAAPCDQQSCFRSPAHSTRHADKQAVFHHSRHLAGASCQPSASSLEVTIENTIILVRSRRASHSPFASERQPRSSESSFRSAPGQNRSPIRARETCQVPAPASWHRPQSPVAGWLTRQSSRAEAPHRHP